MSFEFSEEEKKTIILIFISEEVNHSKSIQAHTVGTEAKCGDN